MGNHGKPWENPWENPWKAMGKPMGKPMGNLGFDDEEPQENTSNINLRAELMSYNVYVALIFRFFSFLWEMFNVFIGLQ